MRSLCDFYHHHAIVFVCLLLLGYHNYVNGFGYDYTVLVPAGRKECFYQPIVDTLAGVEFDFQVLDQSPINFEIKSPSSSIVVADINRPHNSHKLHLTEKGIYEICLDSRYVRHAVTVYLGLYSEVPDETWPFKHLDERENSQEVASTIMEMSSNEIIKSIETMQLSAEKMRFLQQSIRSSNVKDYIVQRANFSRVNLFSGGQLVVMVLASVTQVYTIRKLFTNVSAISHNMKVST